MAYYTYKHLEALYVLHLLQNLAVCLSREMRRFVALQPCVVLVASVVRTRQPIIPANKRLIGMHTSASCHEKVFR